MTIYTLRCIPDPEVCRRLYVMRHAPIRCDEIGGVMGDGTITRRQAAMVLRAWRLMTEPNNIYPPLWRIEVEHNDHQ